MISQLRERHEQEILTLRDDKIAKTFKKYRWSKGIVNIKKQEDSQFMLKNYQQAELLKQLRIYRQEEECGKLQDEMED